MFCLTGYSNWVNSGVSSELCLRFFSHVIAGALSSDCWGTLTKTNFLKGVYKSDALASLNIASGSEANMTTLCEMDFLNFKWLI